MLFRASERLNRTRTPAERAQGAALALLVQASFVLIDPVVVATPLAVPPNPAHETILLLPPIAKITPRTIDARGPETRTVHAGANPDTAECRATSAGAAGASAAIGHRRFRALTLRMCTGTLCRPAAGRESALPQAGRRPGGQPATRPAEPSQVPREIRGSLARRTGRETVDDGVQRRC